MDEIKDTPTDRAALTLLGSVFDDMIEITPETSLATLNDLWSRMANAFYRLDRKIDAAQGAIAAEADGEVTARARDLLGLVIEFAGECDTLTRLGEFNGVVPGV